MTEHGPIESRSSSESMKPLESSGAAASARPHESAENGGSARTLPRRGAGRFAFPLLLAAAVAAVLLWFGKSPEEGPFVGNRAPRFAVMNLEGELVESSEFAGKPLFINFWATWCEPCRYEMPEIQALYEESDGAFEIIAVSDEPLPTVRRYLATYGYTFPVFLDVDRSMNEDYMIYGLPTSVFVDARGIIRAVHRGQLTREQMEAYLALIVPGTARR